MSSVDSGYAWVIPLSCFVIQGTLFGTFRSYGLLYKVLLDSFSISRSDASWPFSLCMTMIHLTGPISGSLNKYFSVRSISFVGCFLSAVGVAVCFLADSSISVIILGIGVVQGFGIGLTYVQNNAIINQYFLKYRGTANGISLSGGTIGAFLISWLLEYSLKQYEFRDCFLVLSGVIMLTLPFCLLLKPFKSKARVIEDGCSNSKHAVMTLARTESVKNGTTFLPSVISSSHQFYASNIQSSILNPIHLTSGIHLKSYSKIREDFFDSHRPPTNQSSQQTVSVPRPVPRMSRSKSFSQASESFFKSVASITKDCMFLLIAVTHMSYFWASITYCMIVVDFAQDKGIAVSDGVDLISGFSVGDLIGRLGSGFAMDKKVMPLKYVAMTCSLGIGVLMSGAVIVHGYWAFVVISAGLGFLSGVINVLLNQLFCKYVGAEKAALAFGISAFMSGAVTTIRPLVVGSFRDQKDGSYDGLFLSLGLASLVTGLLWFLEPVITSRRQEKKMKHLLPDPSNRTTGAVVHAAGTGIPPAAVMPTFAPSPPTG